MKIENAPALELDKALYTAYGKTIPVHVVRERRIVWNLLKHLEANGITPRRIDPGDETTFVSTKKAVMEILFNHDEAWVYFTDTMNISWIRFVLGNDIDVVSDYSINLEKVMSEFNPEAYA